MEFVTETGQYNMPEAVNFKKREGSISGSEGGFGLGSVGCIALGPVEGYTLWQKHPEDATAHSEGDPP